MWLQAESARPQPQAPQAGRMEWRSKYAPPKVGTTAAGAPLALETGRRVSALGLHSWGALQPSPSRDGHLEDNAQARVQPVLHPMVTVQQARAALPAASRLPSQVCALHAQSYGSLTPQLQAPVAR